MDLDNVTQSLNFPLSSHIPLNAPTNMVTCIFWGFHSFLNMGSSCTTAPSGGMPALYPKRLIRTYLSHTAHIILRDRIAISLRIQLRILFSTSFGHAASLVCALFLPLYPSLYSKGEYANLITRFIVIFHFMLF